MTQNQITDFEHRARTLIAERRLLDSIALMRSTARSESLWQLDESASASADHYRFMLQYMARGANDPGRPQMYASILDDANTLLDSLVRALSIPSASTLYFNTLRTRQRAPQSLDDLIAAWHTVSSSAVSPKQVEQAEADIFYAVWTAMPLSQRDADSLSLLVIDPETSDSLRAQVLSALTLGLLKYFDGRRLILLADIYETNVGVADTVAAQALAGLLLGLLRHRSRRLPLAVTERLDRLRGIPEWHTHLRTAFIELARTADTDRVTHTVSTDIIPGIARAVGDATKDLDLDSLQSLMDPDETDSVNPEWQERLDKSGLADALHRLGDMQQQGADVFMGAFSHLKNFPFFRDMPNWFIPFSATNSWVMDSPLPVQLAQTVENLPLLCANDKYSFFLSLSQIPEANREALMQQMGGATGSPFTAMDMPSVTTSEPMRNALSACLRDLYRFFCLFSRKDEFRNPFADSVNLAAVPALSADIADPELLRLVAEFYFSVENWHDAALLFALIPYPDGTIAEKHGYALAKQGLHADAIRAYRSAGEPSPWALTRLAISHQALGQWQECADVCRRIIAAEPERFGAVLRLGRSLFRLGDYAAASEQLFRAEYLRPGHPEVARLLAWSLLALGRPADALHRLQALSEPLDASMALLLGHAGLLADDTAAAIAAYRTALSLMQGDVDALRRAIDADRQLLTAAGISADSLAQAVDALSIQ